MDLLEIAPATQWTFSDLRLSRVTGLLGTMCANGSRYPQTTQTHSLDDRRYVVTAGNGDTCFGKHGVFGIISVVARPISGIHKATGTTMYEQGPGCSQTGRLSWWILHWPLMCFDWSTPPTMTPRYSANAPPMRLIPSGLGARQGGSVQPTPSSPTGDRHGWISGIGLMSAGIISPTMQTVKYRMMEGVAPIK